jgi:hypothetical protein
MPSRVHFYPYNYYHTQWFDDDEQVIYFHREDGPAVLAGPDNIPMWFLNGDRIPVNSQEEFERWIKMRAFW